MGASEPNSTSARIGVAVTTVGRWEALQNLLGDLTAQTVRPCAVAIAHHNAADAPHLDAVVQSFSGRLDIRTTVSPRGISNGRNAAVATLGDDVDWLWFPNDTSRVDADFIERVIVHCVKPTTVCAFRLADRQGPRNSLPAPGTKLSRRNVWGAIEAATLFERDAFVAAGGFDPSIGSGADSPWQACEGTDLLLRMSELEHFSIEWVADIVLHAETEFAHLPTEERRRKLRSYGRGAGNILRTWHYPLWYKVAHVVAAAAMPVRNPAKFGLRESWALMIGRTEGLMGKPFSRGADHRAILR